MYFGFGLAFFYLKTLLSARHPLPEFESIEVVVGIIYKFSPGRDLLATTSGSEPCEARS
jgi:hypothetical protein